MSISIISLIWLTLWINMAQLQQGGPDEKEKTTALKDLLSRIDLDELMKKDEPPLEFPDTLEGFEYAFNEKGQLRHITTGEPFVFNAREDLHRWNQKRYEALGEVDATESEPKNFIFMSEDAMTNPDKLMVLIHGSGVVRAGQWARRLIINEDLDSGTQIPYIKRAMDEGYGVIVLNPNENYIEVEKTKSQVQLSSDGSDEPAEKRERKDKTFKEAKKRRDFYEKYRNPQKEKEMVPLYIRDNGSPEEHLIYVWDHFITHSAAENTFFVAHSYGGLAFVELTHLMEQTPVASLFAVSGCLTHFLEMIQREADVKNKVTAVALTDSVHNVWHQEAGKTIREWMRENCCNWVSSSEPLDTSVESMLPDCPRVSAGTERHELTSWKSLPSIFKFFTEASEAKNSSLKASLTRRSHRIKHEEI
ncbi:cotranscriptional regulator FAM172A isoform X4 [Monodelphis domestica]|uniref:cotranscriptional regulator FAM172A isoform X4 n=1 Tax=Monodelphis domestica TaxID=13616 RepID=UPI0004435BB6|nr:cotranscriptional regulator FAM172A isoform X4 [Monodelphis domestica]XP_007487363.1 cotranscriptional regulator FAM172A isoform X4 [Monodelphis domestica]